MNKNKVISNPDHPKMVVSRSFSQGRDGRAALRAANRLAPSGWVTSDGKSAGQRGEV